MFENRFHLSAYVPKQNINAADLIEATLLQSLWISNFKKSSVDRTISKVLARWFENTLHHSTKKNKNKSILPPSFGKRSQYVSSRILYSLKLQEKIMNSKERTLFLTGTLNALQVRLGMCTPINHSTSVLGRSS
jgi:hypothetical protein